MSIRGFLNLSVLCLALALPALAQTQAPPQDKEREALMKAIGTSSPAERIIALEQFLKDFPNSSMTFTAYSRLLDSYAKSATTAPENVAKAQETAEKIIQTAPEASKAMALNNAAAALADSGILLDKAYEYVQQALELARKQSSSKRTLAMFLDTQSNVELKRNNVDAAEKLQREAISNLPGGADSFLTNQQYYVQLAEILIKSGGTKAAEGAGILAKAVLLGQPRDGDKLMEQAVQAMGASDAEEKKTELIRKAGQDFIAEAPEAEKASAMAKVAIGYHRKNLLPDDALALARKAVDSLRPTTPGQTVLECRGNLGTIYSARKNYKDALAQYEPVARIASPYDQAFFLNYGKSLEEAGRDEDALKAYVTGIASMPAQMQSNSKLMAPLTALYKKTSGSDEGLKDKIAKAGEEMLNFRPSGPAKTSRNGRVVLAELFTGSECGPCVASDVAFDHLLGSYDRGALAVLEYHLHIPGPDPMTNTDTETRMKYYEVRGTPTAAIGGTSVTIGGGARAGAKGRYELYSFDIDRMAEVATPVKLQLSGSLQESTVTVKAAVSAGGSSGDLKLRIVLAEEVIHYKGSNGIEEHRAVVRQMIGTPGGIPLVEGKADHSATIDLAALSESLKAYLENYEKTSTRKDFKWKEKKHEINPANLNLVAFVQDDRTKEVLQASYLKLGASEKSE